MAVYTDIDDAELGQLLDAFDLGAALSCKGIAEGVQNSNFLVETQGGRFILTIFEGRVEAADLPFFLGLMRHLALAGFPTAEPMADGQGRLLQEVRGKPAALVGFLPGLSVRRPSAAHCREAGAGLAWLHEAGRSFEGGRFNTLGHERWADMFAPIAIEAERLKPGLRGVIEQDIETLAAWWPKDLPQGVIHADFFPDNVFFTGGKFSGAIDFYFACTDALAYDVAIALNAWCFEQDGSFNLTSARSFLSGYQSRRVMTQAEKQALPMLMHGAAMRFFLTRLNDWGTTPAGALVKPHDPLEYERKLAVHRAGLGAALFEAAA